MSEHPTIDALLAHTDWIRGLARSLVRDPAAADDLVQETWATALRNPPAADRKLRGWLATVPRRLARQGVREESRRRRRERVAAREEPYDFPFAVRPTPQFRDVSPFDRRRVGRMPAPRSHMHFHRRAAFCSYPGPGARVRTGTRIVPSSIRR